MAEAVQEAVPARRRGPIFGNIVGAHAFEHVFGPASIAALLPSIYDDFGLSGVRAGLLETTRSIGGAIASSFSGVLADLFPHRRGLIMAFSITFLGVFYFLVGHAPTYAVALIAILPAGMCNAAWHAPALATLSHHFPQRRGFAISAHQSGGNIGDFIGPLVVGFLLVSLTWRQVMYLTLPVTLVIGAILAVALWSVGAGIPRPETMHANLGQQLRQLKQALGNRPLLLLILASGIRGLGARSTAIFLALHMSKDLKMSSSLVGLHLGLLTFLAIGFGPFLGAISDRIGRKPVLMVSITALTVLPLAIALAGAGPLLTIAVALHGVFNLVPTTLIQAAAADASGSRVQGSVFGLLWGSNMLFSALSPVIGGLVADLYGFRAVFYYIAIMSGISALILSVVPIPRPTRRVSG